MSTSISTGTFVSIGILSNIVNPKNYIYSYLLPRIVFGIMGLDSRVARCAGLISGGFIYSLDSRVARCSNEETEHEKQYYYSLSFTRYVLRYERLPIRVVASSIYEVIPTVYRYDWMPILILKGGI